MEQVWGWAVRMAPAPAVSDCDGARHHALWEGGQCAAEYCDAATLHRPWTNGKFLAGLTKADPRTSWPGFEAPVTT